MCSPHSYLHGTHSAIYPTSTFVTVRNHSLLFVLLHHSFTLLWLQRTSTHTHTLVCCIASQHTLNQRRLQQYSTPTVYLSPKLPFPHCASSFLFNFPPNTHACELLPHQLTCHASTPAFPGAHPSMDTHFDCSTQLPDQPPASIATPIPFVDLCMIA